MEASQGILDSLRRDAQRSYFRARNGIKYVAGIGRPEVGITPSEIVWTREKARLLRYESHKRTRHPPLVIVWSIVGRSYILDLRPGYSFVEQLLDAGIDVFMLDWGAADAVDASNTLETYSDSYLPEALGAAMDAAGESEVDVLGYCFGGTICVLTVAGNPKLPVRDLVVMATPIDFSHLAGVLQALARGRIEIDDLVDHTGNVPAESVYRSASHLRPTMDISKYANLWEKLWNDQFVEGFQAMGQWLRDQTAFPGACARQSTELLLRRNALLTGEIPLGARRVRLADITCPVLNVMAEHDHLVPPSASEPLGALVGSADVTDLRIPAGHLGLAAGRDAAHITVPRIVEWLNDHSS
jgi:polyhydroxyalkanoate synthase subunit PhaC